MQQLATVSSLRRQGPCLCCLTGQMPSDGPHWCTAIHVIVVDTSQLVHSQSQHQLWAMTNVMGPIRWGVIMVLLGKPHGAGLHIAWDPWPPTHSSAIPDVHVTEVSSDEVAEHILDPQLTGTQQSEVTALLP